MQGRRIHDLYWLFGYISISMRENRRHAYALM